MFDSIESAIEDIKNGKMVVVVDDEDRENEGDLLMAAEFATGDDINLMVKYGRGPVCMPMLKSRLDELKIGAMVSNNTDPKGNCIYSVCGLQNDYTQGYPHTKEL